LANITEISGFVVTFVVTLAIFALLSDDFTYEKRRGRESNPRIAVLQTATLPLGYPADSEKRQTISACGVSVNAVGSVRFHQQIGRTPMPH
jgi:hypothetical protein